MKGFEIKKDIYWVGVKDWNLVEFHGYSTPHGSTYNSYLIMDEKLLWLTASNIICLKNSWLEFPV